MSRDLFPRENLLHCGISIRPLSALGHQRPRRLKPHHGASPLRPKSGQMADVSLCPLPKADLGTATNSILSFHLVGDGAAGACVYWQHFWPDCIACDRYSCFGALQRSDGCGMLFCIQRDARRFRRIPIVVKAVKCAVASNPQAAGPNMRDSKLSRRDMLRASTVLAAGAVFAQPLAAAAPEPTPLSPALGPAAPQEGMLAVDTAMELPVAEGLSKAFEAKYPGINVRVKRSGAERVFQRIGKEEEIRIHEVDVVCSTDAGHFVRWQRDGLLAPFLPEDAAMHLPPEQIGPDGMYATAFASLSPIGYNTNLVKPEDAPTTFADLLDPRWQGKIVKGNPNYSGTIFTATFALSRELGWSYFERLAQQKVVQVESSRDPPNRLARGESAVQADGAHSDLLL